jgi:lipoprotein signal peptidase
MPESTIETELRAAVAERRRRTDAEPNRGWRHVAAIAGVIAILDWTTKLMIASRIPLDEMSMVWEGRIAFWHVRNPALILGLFGDLSLNARKIISFFLAIAAATLLLQIISRAHRLLPRRRPWAWLFGGLLFGGMLGNLGERALHWWVTDFLSFRWGPYWLPPGNVADLAIVLSLPIAIMVIVFEVEARAQRGKVDRRSRSDLVEGDPRSR